MQKNKWLNKTRVDPSIDTVPIDNVPINTVPINDDKLSTFEQYPDLDSNYLTTVG
jgi:hypothetical protein